MSRDYDDRGRGRDDDRGRDRDRDDRGESRTRNRVDRDDRGGDRDRDRDARGDSNRDRGRDYDRRDDRDYRDDRDDRGGHAARDNRRDDRDDRGRDNGRDSTSHTPYVYHRRSKDDIKKHGEGGTYESFLIGAAKWLRPKNGESAYRILPPTYAGSEGGGHYGFKVYTHPFIGADATTYLCVRKMKLGTRCRVCEEMDFLKKEGAEKTEWEDYAPRDGFLCYAIDRDAKEASEPSVWHLSWKQDKTIWEGTQSKRTGETLYIDDPEDGYDVIVKKSGQGKTGTTYNFVIDRDPSPLHRSQKVQDDLLNYALNNPFDQRLKIATWEEIDKNMSGTGKEKSDRDDDRNVGRDRDDRGGRDDRDSRDGDRDYSGRSRGGDDGYDRERSNDDDRPRGRGRGDDDRDVGRGRDDRDRGDDRRTSDRDRDDDRGRDRDGDRDRDSGRDRDRDDSRGDDRGRGRGASEDRDRDDDRGRDRGDDRGDRGRGRDDDRGGRDRDDDRGRDRRRD